MRQAKQKKNRHAQRLRRHRRIRKRIRGTAERPRLTVFRSLRNVEAQIIDDDRGQTLLGLSTLHPELRELASEGEESGPIVRARAAGKRIAAIAKEHGIERVVFDRGGYRYHGRVKAFAEGAREGGLEF